MNRRSIWIMAFMVATLVAQSGLTGEATKLEGKINFNTATVEQLMLLPGVGEKKAQLIIEARKKQQFSSMEDLLAVNGIGEKLAALWLANATFEGPTTLAVK